MIFSNWKDVKNYGFRGVHPTGSQPRGVCMPNIEVHTQCAVNSKSFLWLKRCSFTCFTDDSLIFFLISFLPGLLYSSQPTSLLFLKHIKNASASVIAFFPIHGTLLPRTLQKSFQFIYIIQNIQNKIITSSEKSSLIPPLKNSTTRWLLIHFCLQIDIKNINF